MKPVVAPEVFLHPDFRTLYSAETLTSGGIMTE